MLSFFSSRLVELHGVEPLDALALQWSDNEVIALELVAEHHVAVADGRRGLGCQALADVVISVFLDVLHRRRWQGTHLLWFTHSETFPLSLQL